MRVLILTGRKEALDLLKTTIEFGDIRINIYTAVPHTNSIVNISEILGSDERFIYGGGINPTIEDSIHYINSLEKNGQFPCIIITSI